MLNTLPHLSSILYMIYKTPGNHLDKFQELEYAVPLRKKIKLQKIKICITILLIKLKHYTLW